MNPRHARGFTLTELAIALAIIGILLGGVVLTLRSQIEARDQAETRRTLDVATEALIGFAIQRGRLPCPATNVSSGRESLEDPASVPAGFTAATWKEARGECSVASGFLPGVTLGLSQLDADGYAIDAWVPNMAGANRIRYAVTRDMVQVNGNWVFAFTGRDAMKLRGFASRPNLLVVCMPAPGATSAGATFGDVLDPMKPQLFDPPPVGTGIPPACPGGMPAIQTPAVLFSLGPNGTDGASVDELENLDTTNPRVFVSRPAQPNGFDDVVTFLSLNVLYNRLVAASPL